MSTPDPSNGPQRGGRGGHGWMMIACCIPMIIIAVVLVATGVVGVGWIFVAFACLIMMALMMRGMSGGNGDGHH
ncbi:hypothetical protein SMIR_41450 (plasmid) [Streptomyces mirabilis]|uniref:hypothetical protein n=1 Tax=Streptomyces mirabilis TaxID=68239 RepID=UPI001BAEDD04|nr:hypothetical protein [Streptomyces mirabilis]QUW85878.1 hypothetical protein SMIR_41450 [Streptomyces mirabilis]